MLPILVILITSLTCYAMVLMPFLTIILAIIWGVELILSGLSLSWKYLLVVFLVNIMVLFLAGGRLNIFYYLVFYGVGPMVMALIASLGRSNYYFLQKWGIIAGFLGVSLLLVITYLYNGNIGINEFETQLGQAFQQNLQAYGQGNIVKIFPGQEFSRIEIEQSFKDIAHTLAYHLPAVYYLQAILTTFLALFTSSFFSQKNGTIRLKRRAFEEETMSWKLVWFVIFGLALWLWGKDNNNYIYYTGSNILAILVPIATYFGLAALIYWVRRLGGASVRWMIFLVIMMGVVFLPSAIIFLVVVGLFDALLDYRRLRILKEEQQ